MRPVDADNLYEKACDLEAQALSYVGKVGNDESKIEEWKIWSAILTERTAFKHDVYDAPTIESGPQWTPCSIVNQCYIPELADIGYAGVLFTYVTRTGKRRVRETWVERGRLIGKQMNGVPVAYMPLPEPYREGKNT